MRSIAREDVDQLFHVYLHTTNDHVKQRLVSSVLVQKNLAISSLHKHVFSTQSRRHKTYILILGADLASPDASGCLYYVAITHALEMEVRQTWTLDQRLVMENFVHTDRSFWLQFEKEEMPHKWVLDDMERVEVVAEFLDNVEKASSKLYDTSGKDTGGIGLYPSYQEIAGSLSPCRKTQVSSQSIESIDKSALSLLSTIDFRHETLGDVQSRLRNQLRTSEDKLIPLLDQLEQPSSSVKSSEKGLATSIDDLLLDLHDLETWTEVAADCFEQTAAGVRHFEKLNTDLEITFRNTGRLRDTLEKLFASVELKGKDKETLAQGTDVFPREEHQAAFDSLVQALLNLSLASTSATSFPASEMEGFSPCRQELQKLATYASDKLCTSFDLFLQHLFRDWAATQPALKTSAVRREESTLHFYDSLSSLSLSPSVKKGFFSKKDKISGLDTSAFSRSRASASSVEATLPTEVDWDLSLEAIHTQLIGSHGMMDAVNKLQAKAGQRIRNLYVFQVATFAYNPYTNAILQSLKKGVSKAPRQSMVAPPMLRSFGSKMPPPTAVERTHVLGPPLEKYLRHLQEIMEKEEAFLSEMFQENANGMLEQVFEKVEKRLQEFVETSIKRVEQAVSLSVTLSNLLKELEGEKGAIWMVVAKMRLQVKRLAIKFADEQESWLHSQRVDTRMAGVLSPIKSIMDLIERLEMSAGSETHDSSLFYFYHCMLPLCMSWLEQTANAKAKYSSLTKLENYLYMSNRLEELNATVDLPLMHYAMEAKEQYLINRQLYVLYIWEYEHDQVEKAIKSLLHLKATLAPMDMHNSAAFRDARAPFFSISSTSSKKMHDRMKKHFSSNPSIVSEVWPYLIDHATAKLEQYDQIVQDYYQSCIEDQVRSLMKGLEQYRNK